MGKFCKFNFIKLAVVVIVTISLFIPVFARAEDNAKTGYIHLEQAMRNYEAFVDVMEEVREFESEIESDLRQRREQLEQAHQKLQEEAQFLSPEEQQNRQQELMQTHQQFQMDVQQSQQRIEQKKARLLEPIHQRVQKIVARVAEEKKFDKIVRYDLEGSEIVWVKEELDITEELGNRLAEEAEAGEK